MVLPTSHTTGKNGCCVNFISWNVRGINHPIKCNRVLTHLSHLKVNIAFLQETHLKNADHLKIKKQLVGQIFHSKFNCKARGTAILIHKSIPFIVSNVISDPNGRYVVVTGSLFNTPLILANVYAPNWDDIDFFRKFLHSLPNMDTHQLILGGDMNTVMSPSLDRSSTKTLSSSKSSLVLQSYLDTYGVVDVWRFLFPSTSQYSFFSPVYQTYSRIDYFFVDKKLLSKVRSCTYSGIVISDHSPLLLELSFPNQKCMYSWRLNPLLLSDESFVKYISEQIDIFLKTNITTDVTYGTIWESLKAYLRGHIISYCSFTDKEKHVLN